VLRTIRFLLVLGLLCSGAGTLAAQAALSPSPTLPSDTLEANYAPRSAPGPTPDLSPTLPSDTLDATQPVDSFPAEPFEAPFDQSAPETSGDSAAVRDLRSWIEHHPGLISPPPMRAMLVRV